MSLGYSAQGVDRGVAECLREARAGANFKPLTYVAVAGPCNPHSH